MTENTSIFAGRLEALRQEMIKAGVDGFIVPRTDEYQGEYVPACAERLKWLTGFTGSAGVAIVLKDKAVVMSDGRYTIQLAQQVDANLFEVADSTKTPIEQWLQQHTNKNDTIGFDSRLHVPDSLGKIEEILKNQNITLKPFGENLVDKVWTDKPAPSVTPVTVFPDSIAGLSASEKRMMIADIIRKAGADCVVLTLSDSIAWLLNIRGNDIPHIPVSLSYAVLHADGTLDWCINPLKVGEEIQRHLGNSVRFHREADISIVLSGLSEKSVMLDAKRSSYWFQSMLHQAGAKILSAKDPCIDIRACKTPSEQQAMREAHIRDGLAMARFLMWMEQNAIGQSELSIEETLEGIRRQAPEWRDSSFTTIAGFNENGAIVHYRATPETSKTITNNGLLLLDSGAQYVDGTTDITRTIAIGEVSDEIKRHNTLVLKGHIAVAAARFMSGTCGVEIDFLARQALRAHGLDYAHGTGHGVGCYLSVHEESASLSPRGNERLRPGMILSNEPGYYRQGAYGIRIENLILVKEAQDSLLEFETITCVPIDKSLIVKDMLDPEELSWVNSYHAFVFEKLTPHMIGSEKDWLSKACAPL